MSAKGLQAALRQRERAIGTVPGVNVLAVVNARLAAEGLVCPPLTKMLDPEHRALLRRLHRARDAFSVNRGARQ